RSGRHLPEFAFATSGPGRPFEGGVPFTVRRRLLDAVDRAGVDAQHAADAAALIDHGDRSALHRREYARPVPRARCSWVTFPAFTWIPLASSPVSSPWRIFFTNGSTARSRARLAVRAAAAGMFGTQ